MKNNRIYELNESLNMINESNEPKFEMDPKVGKTYVAILEPYEGHTFYEVPAGTKLKDFHGTGSIGLGLRKNTLGW